MDGRHQAGQIAQIRAAVRPRDIPDLLRTEQVGDDIAAGIEQRAVAVQRHIARLVLNVDVAAERRGGRGKCAVDPLVQLLHLFKRGRARIRVHLRNIRDRVRGDTGLRDDGVEAHGLRVAEGLA